MKTAKELIQKNIGDKVVFSIDGQMIGDLNANDIVDLMDKYLADYKDNLKTVLVRHWHKKTGDEIYDLIDKPLPE